MTKAQICAPYWTGDALGKGRRRDGLAVGTAAAVGAMFGHHDFRLGHIENLPGLISGAYLRRHIKGAVRAALGIRIEVSPGPSTCNLRSPVRAQRSDSVAVPLLV